MAERRMFTQKITESDAFLDMPLSTQALYFHLCMNADDDGFVKNPKRIARMMGAGDDDMKLLIAKAFVIAYESGVIVIKHWRMHNLLRKDRYNETEYTSEKSMLYVKKNGAYTLDEEKGNPLDPAKKNSWQPNGNQMATKWQPNGTTGKERIGKDSKGKDRLGKYNKGESVRGEKAERFVPPDVNQVQEYCDSRNNGIDAQTFVDFYTSKGWMVGKNKMKDWKAAVRTWERNGKRSCNTAVVNSQKDQLAELLNGIEVDEP